MSKFQLLYERVVLNKDKTFTVHNNLDNKDTVIKLKTGGKLYKKTVPHSDLAVQAVFGINSNISSDVKMHFLTSMKSDNAHMPQDDHELILSKAMMFILKYINEHKSEILVLPESSSKLIKELEGKLSHLNLPIFSQITKASIDDVYYDDSGNEKVNKTLEADIRAQKNKGNKHLALKAANKRTALFLRGFFKFQDGLDLDKVAEQFKGKRVMIIDDVLSTGSSIFEIERLIQTLDPESVKAITLFKT